MHGLLLSAPFAALPSTRFRAQEGRALWGLGFLLCPWHLCSLEGQVQMGRVQSGVRFLRGVCTRVFVAFSCKGCSSVEMLQQVWQTWALIIYFRACVLVEEGFSRPSQLHKTQAQEQAAQLPFLLRKRVSARRRLVTHQQRGWPGFREWRSSARFSSRAAVPVSPSPPPPQLLTAAPALAVTG